VSAQVVSILWIKNEGGYDGTFFLRSLKWSFWHSLKTALSMSRNLLPWGRPCCSHFHCRFWPAWVRSQVLVFFSLLPFLDLQWHETTFSLRRQVCAFWVPLYSVELGVHIPKLQILVTLCLNPYWLEQLLRVVTSWNFFLQNSLTAAVSVSYARFFSPPHYRIPCIHEALDALILLNVIHNLHSSHETGFKQELNPPPCYQANRPLPTYLIDWFYSLHMI
jgi:hypothetical protein